jgi:hypothetical protein
VQRDVVAAAQPENRAAWPHRIDSDRTLEGRKRRWLVGRAEAEIYCLRAGVLLADNDSHRHRDVTEIGEMQVAKRNVQGKPAPASFFGFDLAKDVTQRVVRRHRWDLKVPLDSNVRHFAPLRRSPYSARFRRVPGPGFAFFASKGAAMSAFP